MSAEDLDNYETDAELALYKEYRDVIKLFTYVVETERRFYLANKVDFNVRSAGQDVYFDVRLTDAWVWDVYRSSRFVKNVRIVTFKDVNVEEVQKTDIDIPDSMRFLRENQPSQVRRVAGFPIYDDYLWRFPLCMALILCAYAQSRCAFPYLRVNYFRFCFKETSK